MYVRIYLLFWTCKESWAESDSWAKVEESDTGTDSSHPGPGERLVDVVPIDAGQEEDDDKDDASQNSGGGHSPSVPDSFLFSDPEHEPSDSPPPLYIITPPESPRPSPLAPLQEPEQPKLRTFLEAAGECSPKPQNPKEMKIIK